MAEQANVCVKNLSNKDIEVYREMWDGNRDLNRTIPGGDDDTIFLPEPGVFLVISTPNAPNGPNTQTCWFKVTFNEELVEWWVMDDYHWKMQITDNTRPPEVPTNVNVEVGGEPLAP
ncbi:MAG: hypothetical protein PVH61_12220 [Candidatus Aminicenantes bacterium]|jgi:hypothetical protein